MNSLDDSGSSLEVGLNSPPKIHYFYISSDDTRRKIKLIAYSVGNEAELLTLDLEDDCEPSEVTYEG